MKQEETNVTHSFMDGEVKWPFSEMSMSEYQQLALSTAIYPKEMSIIYPTLGLCGESGEVAEKIKKWIRDTDRTEMNKETVELLKKELGDVLWYIANLANDLGLTLNEIAKHNLNKLADRKDRNTLQGSGDTR